jgi:5-methylcytosine-specific restriction endonuclease McrA
MPYKDHETHLRKCRERYYRTRILKTVPRNDPSLKSVQARSGKEVECRACHQQFKPTKHKIDRQNWICVPCERPARMKMRKYDPVAALARAYKRKAAERRVVRTLTSSQWKLLLKIFQGRCAYCLKFAFGGLEQEHVIPISKGGGHTLQNVVPACRACNRLKGDRIWKPLLKFGTAA